MKTSKRILAAVLCLIMLAYSLGGCSKSATAENTTAENSTVAEVISETLPEEDVYTEGGETKAPQVYDSRFHDLVDPSTKIDKYYAAREFHFNELYDEVLTIGIGRDAGETTIFDCNNKASEYYMKKLYSAGGSLEWYFDSAEPYLNWIEGEVVNSFDGSVDCDPLNKFEKIGSISRADGDFTDWIIENVMNGKVSHEDSSTTWDEDRFEYYYYDGYYYIHSGEGGGGFEKAVAYDQTRNADGTYDVIYYFGNEDINPTEDNDIHEMSTCTLHVKAGLIEKDGYYFWSIFKADYPKADS